MLMIVYTLNKDAKEIWCIKVRMFGPDPDSPENPDTPRKNPDSPSFRTPVKNNIHQEFSI
jgi:hypothetical protein